MPAEVIEQGDVYFLYRPAASETRADGLEDVHRFYVVLKPEGKRRIRRLVVGHKRLPDAKEGEARYWGFVDKVADEPAGIRGAFAEETAHGRRTQAPARAAGEGVYAITRHENHTDLAYKLELPETPGDVQGALNIRDEAGFVLAIKNPETHAPPGAGLGEERKAAFPPELKERFRGHRWVDADPPDFLDHEGCEFLLARAHEETGIHLDAERETRESADVLRDLDLGREERLVEPLLTGAWR